MEDATGTYRCVGGGIKESAVSVYSSCRDMRRTLGIGESRRRLEAHRAAGGHILCSLHTDGTVAHSYWMGEGQQRGRGR